MTNSNTDLMNAFHALRKEWADASSSIEHTDFIALNQAFDRLLIGYQNGSFSDDEAKSGLDELRTAFNKSAASPALKPLTTPHRDTVLCRNYQALAEKFLAQERGSWDQRHVDIVQGAVSFLASHGDNKASSIALNLQKRMSDSIWLDHFELADSVALVNQEARNIQNDLIAFIHNNEKKFENNVLDMPEQERTLSTDDSLVKTAVNSASALAIQNKMADEAQTLISSKDSLSALTQNLQNNRFNNLNNDELRRASQSIKDAAQKLLAQENDKLAALYRSALVNTKSSLSSQDAIALADVANDALNNNSASVSARAQNIKAAFKNINNQSLQNAIQDIDRIQCRCDILSQLGNDHVIPQNEDTSSKEAQLLDARMMYEQKRMQFELNPDYRFASSDLIKAFDLEQPAPQVQYSFNTSKNIQNDIQLVRQIAQSSISGNVGLYAPSAGSEHTPNAQNALKTADNAAPIFTPIPTIHNENAKHSNKLLSDIKQLAFMPSVRADMGFSAQRTQIDEQSVKPLFKRVRFSKDNKQANQMLPSLYRVAGIRLDKSDKPLRKAYRDLNLSAANLELVKIIENQFDPNLQGRNNDKTSGVQFDSSQRVDPEMDAKRRVTSIISDWVDARRDIRRLSADTKSLINTNRMDSGSIEASLKSEAIQLPTSVQQKLSPFLGFDLSNIKIYDGPIAAMASEAMGAHAFTLGKSIFLGENKLDFNSPEGLGLLAHEILHTSHFGSGDSVDNKEQAAEAMEARVKNAFGSTNFSLALEHDSAKKTDGKTDERSSATGTMKPYSVGSRLTYDPDYVFDTVCEKVLDLIRESIRVEKESGGSE